MARMKFICDAERCIECNSCVTACKAEHDIPLLFEKGGWDKVDRIAVVSAPQEVQRARVLARPGMSEEKLARILALQLPDEEKRARADFVIPTGGSFDETRAAVRSMIACLTAPADS